MNKASLIYSQKIHISYKLMLLQRGWIQQAYLQTQQKYKGNELMENIFIDVHISSAGGAALGWVKI
jgi:hypothetical protein